MKSLVVALMLAITPFQTQTKALGARAPTTRSDHAQLIKAAQDVQRKMTEQLHSPTTVKALFDSEESDTVACLVISAKGITVVEVLIWEQGKWMMSAHLLGDKG